MKKLFSVAIVLVSSLAFGCTTLLFESPIPSEGRVIQALPDFFEGEFLVEHSTQYYRVERLNDQHCIVYKSLGLPEDSLTSLIETLNTDSTFAKREGNILTLKGEDSDSVLNFRLINGIYFFEASPEYEINLKEGYYIDNFKTRNKEKVIFKHFENTYYLNFLDGNKWFLIWFKEEENNIIVRNSSIESPSDFSENFLYYDGITSIEKLSKDSYLANPSDEELFTLFNEPDLFESQKWIRLKQKQRSIVRNLALGIVLTVLASLIVLLIQKRRAAFKKDL